MKSGGSLSIWFFIGVSDLKGFHLPQPGFLGSGGGGCVCHPANHFLVGGNHEIRWIVVDLVLHRRVRSERFPSSTARFSGEWWWRLCLSSCKSFSGRRKP